MSIQARSIRKTYGKTIALDSIDLTVETGYLVALVGPSGSGKTTLLRILAGLEAPDPGSGEILFHGQAVNAQCARDRGAGMVFQHYALFRHMTVADNIAFGLSVRERSRRPAKKAIRARVRELLQLVQLEGYDDRLPHELSGGQRQRVALARALAVEPKVLLLDEPFGALDAKVRKDLRRWLRQFHEQIGLTSVFVTHDQEEALELADKVVVMNKASIVQEGSPQEVFDHPASPFVIEFLGNVNRVTAGYGALAMQARDSLYVRPHDIELTLAPTPSNLAVKVLHVFSAGSVAQVTLRRLDTGELLEAEVPRFELERLRLQPGQELSARFRHIRLFAKDPSGKTQLIEREL